MLARAYPLHLIIKNIKESPHLHPQQLAISTDTTYRNKSILPILTPFSYTGKSFIGTIRNNWHTINDEFTLSAVWRSKSYLPTQNQAAFTTILSNPHKHMVYHNTIPNTATHIHLHTPKHIGKHTHTAATLFYLPPNSSTQWLVVMTTW